MKRHWSTVAVLCGAVLVCSLAAWLAASSESPQDGKQNETSTISLEVIDAQTQKGLPALVVDLNGVEGASKGATEQGATDAMGKVVFRNMPIGKYIATVRGLDPRVFAVSFLSRLEVDPDKPTEFPTSFPFEFSVIGKTFDEDVIVPRAAVLVGTVKFQDNTRIKAHVDPLGDFGVGVDVDADGRFTILGLLPGPDTKVGMRVDVFDLLPKDVPFDPFVRFALNSDLKWFIRGIEVKKPGESKLDIVIPKPDMTKTSVEGKITFQGAEVGGTTAVGYVLAQRENEFVLLGTFDSAGNYKLSGLPPGKYSVIASVLRSKDSGKEKFSKRVQLEVPKNQPVVLDIDIYEKDVGLVPPK